MEISSKIADITDFRDIIVITAAVWAALPGPTGRRHIYYVMVGAG